MKWSGVTLWNGLGYIISHLRGKIMLGKNLKKWSIPLSWVIVEWKQNKRHLSEGMTKFPSNHNDFNLHFCPPTIQIWRFKKHFWNSWKVQPNAWIWLDGASCGSAQGACFTGLSLPMMVTHSPRQETHSATLPSLSNGTCHWKLVADNIVQKKHCYE